jgi:hypothetical protein
MGRQHLTALVAGLVLAAPSVAAAQSAGDNQYEDPFAGPQQEQPQQPAQPQPEQPATPAQSAPQGSDVAVQAPVVPGETAVAQPGAVAELPRTGPRLVTLLVSGLALLAAGSWLARRTAHARR